MPAALLLVDVQNDFLHHPALFPDAAQLVAQTTALLQHCRSVGVPVVHVVTRVSADGAGRMPHWAAAGCFSCVEGSPGAQAPAELAPADGEPVFCKTFFSAFDAPELQPWLVQARIDTVIVAGLYTHACVRSTVLDAYQRGLTVWLAQDAVASYDAEHARLSLAWLEGRAASVLRHDQIQAHLLQPRGDHSCLQWEQRNPSNWQEVLAQVPLCRERQIQAATDQAGRASPSWSALPAEHRQDRLRQWQHALQRDRAALAQALVTELGKPLTNALAECDFAHALIDHAIQLCEHQEHAASASFKVLHRAHGVLGLITPWNNPLAIPAGKIAAALALGNTVVFKPALPTHRITALLMATLGEAGLEAEVACVTGDARTGELVVTQPGVNAIALTGSVAAGRSVAGLCAQHGKPLQGELGGNNAVLVWDDADPQACAEALAPALFSFSGQRCTAPRRLIVAARLRAEFEACLLQAIAGLRIGAPGDPATQVGPLISRAQQQRMQALVAQDHGPQARVLCGGRIDSRWPQGCWFEPTLIADAHPASAVVQREAFGPVVSLMTAQSFEGALTLCNDVPQGLVASLFTHDTGLQQAFVTGAHAGVLCLNQGLPPIHAAAPFGGWKASGLGPPEHGRWDFEFNTRVQAVYGF
jgi:acyl-CoA reductase-like NAD-dependent aldehyde dehydrogenase/nicotinamidase-related amidase